VLLAVATAGAYLDGRAAQPGKVGAGGGDGQQHRENGQRPALGGLRIAGKEGDHPRRHLPRVDAQQPFDVAHQSVHRHSSAALEPRTDQNVITANSQKRGVCNGRPPTYIETRRYEGSVMESTNTVREVSRVVTAHKQREGGGFIVRRPFP